MKRLHIKIRGRVQGVFFRAHAEKEAKAKNLAGWVRNCSDGSVEILAEGEEPALKGLLEWCHKGSPGSDVMDVKSEWEKATGEFKKFEIIY